MNVLLIVRNFNVGGAENHVCDLANALVNEGVNVLLIAGKGRQKERLDAKVRLLTLTINAYKSLWQIPHIIYVIRKHKIDVIHAHQRTSAWFAVVAGAISRTPVFFSIHGRIRKELRSPVIRNGISKVIVFSSNNFNRLKQMPPLSQKVLLIRGYLPIKRNKSTSEEFPPSIAYISRIDARHGAVLEILLRHVWPAFTKIYPQSKLLVVGDGSALKWLKKVANEPGDCFPRDSVVFHGYLKDVTTVYAATHLVLGVGRVATEALIHAKPVLSIKHGRMGEIVTTTNFDRLFDTNFVDTHSNGVEPEKMVEMMTDFFANLPFYQSETEQLSRQLRQIFDRKNCIEPLIDAYRDAVDA
jgi:glycosyltransferase involved in cell wall biosynthesis